MTYKLVLSRQSYFQPLQAYLQTMSNLKTPKNLENIKIVRVGKMSGNDADTLVWRCIDTPMISYLQVQVEEVELVLPHGISS